MLTRTTRTSEALVSANMEEVVEQHNVENAPAERIDKGNTSNNENMTDNDMHSLPERNQTHWREDRK